LNYKYFSPGLFLAPPVVIITTTTTVMAATVSTLRTDIEHLLWAVADGEWATVFLVPSL